MKTSPMISVITPAYNAKSYIECAIKSVCRQNYGNFEHIVIDGGSQDGTVEVLKQYPHLRWISEPDKGQSDAMNKGFGIARGDYIVYLNADDYFEPNAFQAVLTAFETGANFVVGRVKVLRANGKEEVNDPKVEFAEMLRWWLPDAYCYNSAGYFYHRDVQELVGPFNIDDQYTMDYEFLLKAAQVSKFVKVPDVLACFRLFPGTKTLENSSNEYNTFKRFDEYLELLGNMKRQQYLEEKEKHFGFKG